MNKEKWAAPLADCQWMNKKLIFILGKGGVGKSTIADASARILAKNNKRVLLCHVLQIEDSQQKIVLPEIEKYPSLSEITLNTIECFSEYIHMKLPIKAVANILLKSNVIQYFEKAAPGVRELVLLGKLWYETKNYDHIVVDMPSTGYALTMIHTPFNYAKLFPGGPIFSDAKEMIKTFSDSKMTAFVTVSLPEEMPIQESLDVQSKLSKLVPENPPWIVINRKDKFTEDESKLFEENKSENNIHNKNQILWNALKHRNKKIHAQDDSLVQLKTNWILKSICTLEEFNETN